MGDAHGIPQPCGPAFQLSPGACPPTPPGPPPCGYPAPATRTVANCPCQQQTPRSLPPSYACRGHQLAAESRPLPRPAPQQFRQHASPPADSQAYAPTASFLPTATTASAFPCGSRCRPLAQWRLQNSFRAYPYNRRNCFSYVSLSRLRHRQLPRR